MGLESSKGHVSGLLIKGIHRKVKLSQEDSPLGWAPFRDDPDMEQSEDKIVVPAGLTSC